MGRYQEALNKIIRSCCSYCEDNNGCQNCKIKQRCNATAKSWVDTLQELIDKEEIPMKVDKTTIRKEDMTGEGYYFLPFACCPNCKRGVSEDNEYCPHCGQKLDWSDSDE